MNTTLLILNGKKAGEPTVRAAVEEMRGAGRPVDVRVTWEAGDIDRFIGEACERGLDRVVIGGGDGSVSEAVHAVMQRSGPVPALAFMPLGTANDFASACGIPLAPSEALQLAVSGDTVSIDAAKANGRHFVNVASVGFGAAVTANTPVELKNFLGGGAYTLSGLVQALNIQPYPCHVVCDDREIEGELLIGAICNGRTAGGRQPLAPGAMLDDGQLDVLIIHRFAGPNAKQVLQELMTPDLDGEYVERFRTSRLDGKCDVETPFNLDGEPYSSKTLRVSVLPRALEVVLPPECPCLCS